MFRPASDLPYRRLSPEAQALVVTVGDPHRWRDVAVASIRDDLVDLRDVVRDVLANPQVRAVVFDGPCRNRDAFADFWEGRTDTSAWGIETEHLDLVRRFVDLFDDEYATRGPLQAFWPARIHYTS